MRFSLSFLASDIKQLPTKGVLGNSAVEGVIFDYTDLIAEKWDLVWKNISIATDMYGPAAVTFHFPMNNCDFVDNKFVLDRLKEAYSRASNLGLAGVVVHSNRIRSAEEWARMNIRLEQDRVIDKLMLVVSSGFRGDTWLGIENMPIIGNYGDDTDPLFCFSDDFLRIPNDLSVTWDVCHSASSQAYLSEAKHNRAVKDILVRDSQGHSFDLSLLGKKIKHWHFSSFRGLNGKTPDAICEEGLLPIEGDLPEDYYTKLVIEIRSISPGNSIVNFEVQEDNYYSRIRGPKICRWFNEC